MMYDLIMVLFGEAYVLETGQTLEACQYLADYMYVMAVAEGSPPNAAYAAFTCEAAL